MKGKNLKGLARSLRRRATKAEARLWRYLRSRQLGGYKFRRQLPVGPYLADFCCLEEGLIVELDGGQHDEGRQNDQARTDLLNGRGFHVIRFWNNEVFGNMEGVLESILQHLQQSPSPSSSGSGAGVPRLLKGEVTKGKGILSLASPSARSGLHSPLKGEDVRRTGEGKK